MSDHLHGGFFAALAFGAAGDLPGVTFDCTGLTLRSFRAVIAEGSAHVPDLSRHFLGGAIFDFKTCATWSVMRGTGAWPLPVFVWEVVRAADGAPGLLASG